MPHVFLTIDTEIAWRHHAAGLPADEVCRRSFEPGGVGLHHQLALLARHGLKACFFVDPLPALVYGLAPVRRVVEAILAAGQEVQLHLHPQWAGALPDNRSVHGRFQLWEHDERGQRALIEGAGRAAHRHRRAAADRVPRRQLCRRRRDAVGAGPARLSL